MRIAEVESQVKSEKKGALVTLLTMLKTKADSSESGLTLPFIKLAAFMNNLGHGITYEELNHLVKSSNAVNNLIHTYSPESVTVKTNNISDTDQEVNPGNQDTVKQMAKRATKRRK